MSQKKKNSIITSLKMVIFLLIVLLIALLWLKYYSTMEATDLPKSVDQSEQLKYI